MFQQKQHLPDSINHGLIKNVKSFQGERKDFIRGQSVLDYNQTEKNSKPCPQSERRAADKPMINSLTKIF